MFNRRSCELVVQLEPDSFLYWSTPREMLRGRRRCNLMAFRSGPAPTIAGAGREAPVVARRERGKTVCARGASLAPVRGRSASPLGYMETMFAAAAILSPFGLMVSVLIPTIAIILARRPHLSPVA